MGSRLDKARKTGERAVRGSRIKGFHILMRLKIEDEVG